MSLTPKEFPHETMTVCGCSRAPELLCGMRWVVPSRET